jgi:hypothetical protein
MADLACMSCGKCAKHSSQARPDWTEPVYRRTMEITDFAVAGLKL